MSFQSYIASLPVNLSAACHSHDALDETFELIVIGLYEIRSKFLFSHVHPDILYPTTIYSKVSWISVESTYPL